MKMKFSTTTIAVATLAVLVAGCSEDLESDGGDADATGTAGDATAGAATEACEPGDAALDGASITVASKNYDEQFLLGNITKVLLEDAGVNVDDQIDLGGSNVLRDAELAGEIDVYWEYTGTAWATYFGETEFISDRDEDFQTVSQRDAEENGLCWLDPAGYNNTYGIAFRSEAADELGNPETLADLGTVIEEQPDAATLCVEAEFATRDDGLIGMEEAYGYSFPADNITELDEGPIYQATDRGDPCNFGEIYTTDGRVGGLDLTVLEDNDNFFPLYSAAPVFRSEIYDEYGQALDELFAPVTDLLTQEKMTELNARVSSDNERPEAVAQDFLESNDLLG